MRWWLAVAFAGVAALTAVAVVSVLNARSEHAFRKYAENFAVGDSVTVAERLKDDTSLQMLRLDTAQLASQRKLSLFVFDAAGRPLTQTISNGTDWRKVPHRDAALRSALARNRFIGGAKDGSAIVVGLLIHGGAGSALVAYSSRPDLATQLGIVRNEFLLSALIAIVVGAAAGFVVAMLTGRRLARIASTARALGAGDFSATVVDRFPDEVGSLAESIEQMRVRLSGLFDALRDDHSRLERLLDRLDEAVLVVDPDLRIEFANDRARELFRGETLDDAARSPFAPEEELALRGYAKRLFEKPEPGHLRLATDDDRTFLVSGVTPTLGSENAILVLFDESQRERAERAQRRFATNAAHELRTPLASIVTAIEMLQTGAKSDPAARDEFLDLIERESSRLSRLTRALLVLSRAEAREEQPRWDRIEVRGLLDEIVSGLPVVDTIEVSVVCDADVSVSGDRDLLEQAVTNLATNALQHTAAGAVVLRGSTVGGQVLIEVADTGQGMPAGTRARAFDRFYRAGDADGGFGLGLAIARESVRALGGDVAIDSTPGLGTTVRITLQSSPTAEAA